jgi:hypothetical protein
MEENCTRECGEKSGLKLQMRPLMTTSGLEKMAMEPRSVSLPLRDPLCCGWEQSDPSDVGMEEMVVPERSLVVDNFLDCLRLGRKCLMAGSVCRLAARCDLRKSSAWFSGKSLTDTGLSFFTTFRSSFTFSGEGDRGGL